MKWRGGMDVLEVTARVGPGGSLRVEDIGFTRETRWFVENKGGAEPEKHVWEGPRAPPGIWDAATLQEFMRRPEVIAHTPYIALEISWDDALSDVLRCLASVKLVAAPRVEPILRDR